MQTFRQTFEAMASTCEVVLSCEDAAAFQEAARAAINEVKRIEQKYSRYLSGSMVSRINAMAGVDWVECDEETLALLGYADTLFQLSGGLFDVTSGVLRKAWNFKEAVVPTSGQLLPLLERIGWDRVERRGNAIRLPEAGMEIDVGGFGKEYATDQAAAVLTAQGMQHGYVNLAGDMRIIGPKPDGQPWVIGIQHPRQPGDLIASIPVETGALATSGDYERFFESGGRRYCHVMEPRTGQPVSYWRSVSVLAPMAIVAGSCTTIAMLKQGDGIAFLEEAGMDYLAMDYLGRLYQKERNAE